MCAQCVENSVDSDTFHGGFMVKFTRRFSGNLIYGIFSIENQTIY